MTRAVNADERFLRCERKQGYSFERARKIAKRMRRQHDRSRVEEYFCRDCQHWHVGERFK
jgi:hypothetical protein